MMVEKKEKDTTIEEHYIYVGGKEETRVRFKGMGYIILNKDTEFIITTDAGIKQVEGDKRFKKKSVKSTKEVKENGSS